MRLGLGNALAVKRAGGAVSGAGVTIVDSTKVNAINTSFVVNKPAGVLSGDLLVFFIYFSNHTRTIGSVPSGAAQYLASVGASLDTIYVYTKVAGGSEPASYTFNNDGISDRGAVVCVALRGAVSINSASSVTRSAGTGATTTSAFSATKGGVQLVMFCSDDSRAAPVVSSAPSGFTELESNLAAFNHMWVGGKEGAISGTIASTSLTWDNGASVNRTNVCLIASA